MDQKKDFLQSEGWLRFQEAAGYEIVQVKDDGFSVGGIVHSLPIVGKYLYTPRYPSQGISNFKFQISKVIGEARSHGCGWVRMEPENEKVLGELKSFVCHPALDAGSRNSGLPRFARNDNAVENGRLKLVRAPHDMQPRETFVVDISKNEEVLLAEMKPKVRYNIRLAEKKGVRVFFSTDEKYRTAFVDLVTGTADRKGIVPHPRRYYETMLETLLGDTATLFIAEHEGDILGANLMIFHSDTATYLHGGSGYVKREYMAPFLLQWEAMKEARRRGCTRYDFGGVKSRNKEQGTRNKENGWEGITRFKTGFSPATAPTVFPGCYDIILSPSRYFLYTLFSALRAFIVSVRKSIGV